MNDSSFLQVAVARYADRCIPPSELQVDCPFVQRVADGLACMQQCRDVQLHLSRVYVDESDDSAYDAQKHLLNCRELSSVPDSRWDPPALAVLLDQTLMSPPFLQGGTLKRAVDGTQALAELARCGLEPSAVLGAKARGFAIGMDLFLRPGMTEWDVEDDRLLDGWRRLRARFVSGGEEDDFSESFQSAVEAWVRTADAEDVLMRRPPEVLPPAPRVEPTQIEKEYAWVLTRLGRTYLDQWDLDSLLTEHRWLRKVSTLSHVPSVLTAARETSLVEVSNALATRLSDERDTQESVTVQAITAQAIDLVESGEFSVAANLFAAARRMQPGNWELVNNHAFCLLPGDASAALKEFDEASRLRGESEGDSLIAMNRALALVRLGRISDAFEQVELITARALPDRDAVMWSGGEDPQNWISGELQPVNQELSAYVGTLSEVVRALLAEQKSQIFE